MQTQTFNIALPKKLVQKIDKTAKKEYKNRSEFIREAVLVYLQRKEGWERIFTYGRKKAREFNITSEKQVNDVVYKFRHGRKSC